MRSACGLASLGLTGQASQQGVLALQPALRVEDGVTRVYQGFQAAPTRRHARAQVAGEPAYDTLRTKEQLGYSVHAGVRLTHGMLGYGVNVVSGARRALRAPAWPPASATGGRAALPRRVLVAVDGACVCRCPCRALASRTTVCVAHALRCRPGLGVAHVIERKAMVLGVLEAQRTTSWHAQDASALARPQACASVAGARACSVRGRAHWLRVPR